MKKTTIRITLSAAAIVIAACTFVLLHRPQVIKLSDGTKLTFLGVTYGKHHVAPKAKVAGGRRTGRNTVDSTNNTLVVWVMAEHKPNQWPNYTLLAYDHANTAAVGTWSRNNSQLKNGVDVQAFMFDAYPRWDRKLTLRAMSWNGNQRISKESFTVPNPGRATTIPAWKADKLPIAQSDGDLEVTLTRLTFGHSGFMGSATSKDAANKAVGATFHTVQNGTVVTNWQPVRVEMSDAAGNQVVNNSWSNSRNKDGDAEMTFQPSLWPDHAPWKLNVEMSRTSGFSDSELWSVTNLPVQPGDWNQLWNYNNPRQGKTNSVAFAETTLNDIHLKIFPAIRIQQGGGNDRQGGLRIQCDPNLPPGTRLTATATDEQGRKLENWGPNENNGSYVVQFPNVRNAATLNLTIAVHKSRFVEYTATPDPANSTGR